MKTLPLLPRISSHSTRQQEGRCKHVIHPCEEIQPLPRARRQPERVREIQLLPDIRDC